MKAVLVILTILSLQTAYAAGSDDYIPKSPTEGLSPTAKSFQRYGDIPVSLYTGTPNVTIPLATLRNGTLTIPVELSYHCGGVKPDERPGSTGLGWNLSIGGAITRAKYNFPDELSQAGFLYTHGLTKTLDKYPATIETELWKDNRVPSFWYIRDTQPDKFSFSFLGYSGFFMLNNSGEWVVSCDRPLKLVSHRLIHPFDVDSSIFPAANSDVFGSFVLQGEDGTLYTFGGKSYGVYAIDMSINFMMQNSYSWESNAWYLTKIQHPNGETITFQYIHPGFSANFTNNEYAAAQYNPQGAVIGYSLPDEHQGVLTYPAYLKGVESDNFKLSMSYSKSRDLDYSETEYAKRLSIDASNNNEATRPVYFGNCNTIRDAAEKVRPYKLDNISVTYMDGYYATKNISFSYDESTNKRLMLSSVAFSGNDNKTGERYRFKYHRPDRMPRYLERMNDHWGYYNEIKYDADSIMVSNASAGKEQIFGSLREIEYPTGGKTVFEFEPNTYSRVSNSETTGDLSEVEQQRAGGIRIKRIINVPNDNTVPEVREFFYVRDFAGDTTGCKSSGILEGMPVYQNRIRLSNGYYIFESSENTLSNIINPSGFHIGYQEVVERNSDGDYSISRFTSAADPGFKDEAPIANNKLQQFIPTTSRACLRGRLMSEQLYDNTGKLIKKRDITYGIIGGRESYIHSLFLNRLQLSVVGSNKEMLGFTSYSLFKIYNFQIKEQIITETQFGSDPLHPFIRQQYFRYNSKGQLAADSIVTMRQGCPEASLTRFAYEWMNNPVFAEHNYLSYPSEITKFNRGKEIGKTVIEYGLTDASVPAPYVKTVKSKSGYGNQHRSLYACHDYDNRCRPLLVRDADGNWIAYIWREFHFIPAVEIRLAAKEDYEIVKTMSASLPEEGEDLSGFLATLHQNLPDAMATCYQYSLAFGVTSTTDPSGRTSKYDYDPMGRLIRIFDPDGKLTDAYRYSIWSGN